MHNNKDRIDYKSKIEMSRLGEKWKERVNNNSSK